MELTVNCLDFEHSDWQKYGTKSLSYGISEKFRKDISKASENVWKEKNSQNLVIKSIENSESHQTQKECSKKLFEYHGHLGMRKQLARANADF